ncbi:helix-turn-helix transcriptional regulator [Arthrobacter silvisoli]|uniref:helix-turn-helix transcriptional regulator n=1 Tax=Arthrobacter silvisoli TaxID=2291022 RepID=UPI000E20D4EC|nr:helix-turn-helix transcriptional regulator [Arthrobacter silvisoli]
MSRETQRWGDASIAFEPGKTDAGAGSHMQWSVAARGREMARVREALGRPEVLGVVITGAQGVGKSSMGRLVVSSLDNDPYVIHLRSASTGEGAPYSCFSFMLARLPQKYLSSPTGILQGITSLIREDAAGRDVVLVLDNPGGTDEMSTGVLMNILLTGAARIIAIAQQASDLPVDFHWFLQEGRLAEVQLETLGHDQTAEVLSKMLGHRMTAALVSRLHTASGGNPLLLESLVAEQRAAGNLVLLNSVWTLRGDLVMESAHGLEEVVRARWTKESPEAREIVEMLACARRVPLGRLAAVYDAKTLADMEDSGLLTVDDSPERWTSLRQLYVADIVRSWLTVPRRRQLRATLLDGQEPDAAGMSEQEILSYAALSRDAQVPLSPAHALVAAGAAVRRFDPLFALECAGGIQRSDPEWVAGQCRKAEALILMADYGKALAEVEDVTPEQLDALPARQVAMYFAARGNAMRWAAGRAEEAMGIIREGRERLASLRERASDAPSVQEELAAAERRLDLEGFAHAAYLGNYTEIIEALEAASADQDPAHLEHSLACGVILIEAYSVTGRELDALRLAEFVNQRMESLPATHGLRDYFRLSAFCANLQAGQWRSCLRMLDSGSSASPSELQYRGAVLELAVGLANLFAGRGAKALDFLLPAVAQLEHRSVMGLLQLAYAATAFAYAQIGDSSNAYSYLAMENDAAGSGAFLSNRAREFCSDMARRWLGEPEARERLIAAAREDLAHGRYTTAGLNVVGATVNGRDEDFRLMEEIAGHRQGSLARLSALMAKGSLAESPRIMMEAADLAASLELDAMEARCVALALDYSRSISDHTTLRQAQARLDRLSQLLVELPVVPHGNTPLLTERERQIARMAGHGVSNRDIAKDIGVSVRTVEGHLYQVFAKLSVSSRRDLLGLI